MAAWSRQGRTSAVAIASGQMLESSAAFCRIPSDRRLANENFSLLFWESQNESPHFRIRPDLACLHGAAESMRLPSIGGHACPKTLGQRPLWHTLAPVCRMPWQQRQGSLILGLRGLQPSRSCCRSGWHMHAISADTEQVPGSALADDTGSIQAVIFDMDGVLCNTEEIACW